LRPAGDRTELDKHILEELSENMTALDKIDSTVLDSKLERLFKKS
jgi:hypothetical protein